MSSKAPRLPELVSNRRTRLMVFAGSAGFASTNWQDASSSGPVETSAGPPAGFGIE